MERLLGAPAKRLSWLRSAPTQQRGWVCQSCRGRGKFTAGRKFSSSSSSSSSVLQEVEVRGKPYYVTTPIFYVNASPHIGHLYSMLLADVLKRWELLKGRDAILCTGTDEHGMKVQRAAEQQDIAPKALCDANSETFRDLARRAGVANDHFVRTTDPDHRQAVQHFWQRLAERGYLYETKHEGWYCVGDETYYPESLVEKRFDPQTGHPFIASAESGAAVEWTEERNYHFRLTALRGRLLQFYRENPDWVTPATRMAEVVDWVENHLEDLSVSRPADRLAWGIPVPGDPDQTIYVWVDALVNYLTKAGYPRWSPGSERAGGWPADVHVIGKDIVRFHCVYWPALLLALDLPLPRRVLSHAHWLINARKMSKSTGNVVNPFFALDRWGVDPLRYFLLYGGSVASDAEYSNALVAERYKKGLQTGLGNLLSRITRPTTWSVRRAVVSSFSSGGGGDSGGGNGGAAMAFETMLHHSDVLNKQYLDDMVRRADEQMADLNPGVVLRDIMECIFETNRYLASKEPWALAKTGDVAGVDRIIFMAAESLRIAGILLQPFIPGKAGGVLDRLGVDPARRTFADARLRADAEYGEPLAADMQTPLFPPLPVAD